MHVSATAHLRVKVKFDQIRLLCAKSSCHVQLHALECPYNAAEPPRSELNVRWRPPPCSPLVQARLLQIPQTAGAVRWVLSAPGVFTEQHALQAQPRCFKYKGLLFGG